MIERYVRTESAWVKVIRNTHAKQFQFTIGNAGETFGHTSFSYPFQRLTWESAIDLAQRRIGAGGQS